MNIKVYLMCLYIGLVLCFKPGYTLSLYGHSYLAYSNTLINNFPWAGLSRYRDIKITFLNLDLHLSPSIYII